MPNRFLGKKCLVSGVFFASLCIKQASYELIGATQRCMSLKITQLVVADAMTRRAGDCTP